MVAATTTRMGLLSPSRHNNTPKNSDLTELVVKHTYTGTTAAGGGLHLNDVANTVDVIGADVVNTGATNYVAIPMRYTDHWILVIRGGSDFGPVGGATVTVNYYTLR